MKKNDTPKCSPSVDKEDFGRNYLKRRVYLEINNYSELFASISELWNLISDLISKLMQVCEFDWIISLSQK